VPHVLGVDGAINMIDQLELVKSGIEEGAPSRERHVTVVEGDRHMSAVVHVLDGRDGDSGGRAVTEGVPGAGDGGSRLDTMSIGGANAEEFGSEKADTIGEEPMNICIDLNYTYTRVNVRLGASNHLTCIGEN
jgi:hypothetical protein